MMNALAHLFAIGGIAQAIYALSLMSAHPTPGNTAMLGVGCAAALVALLKLS